MTPREEKAYREMLTGKGLGDAYDPEKAGLAKPQRTSRPESQQRVVEGYRALLSRVEGVRAEIDASTRLLSQVDAELRGSIDTTNHLAVQTAGILSKIVQSGTSTMLASFDLICKELERKRDEISDVSVFEWESRRAGIEEEYARDAANTEERMVEWEAAAKDAREMLSSGDGGKESA